MDVSRTSDSVLSDFLEELFSAGAERIRLSDTVGTATPVLIQEWSRLYKSRLSCLEFHGHNDLGMATANAHTAVFCGFGTVSGTVTGIGERAGNTSWEELIPALTVTRTANTEIDPEKLFLLSNFVRNITGEKVSPRQPFVGKNVFSHESGLHANSFFHDPLAFQCCLPEKWGLPPGKVTYGTHTGIRSLELSLRNSGIGLNEMEKKVLLDMVRSRSAKKKKPIEKEELLSLYRNMRKSRLFEAVR